MTTRYQIVEKGSEISGFKVLFFIKDGLTAQSYRVRGENGKIYFLKLFSYSNIPRSAFDSEGNFLEPWILKDLDHPNIVKYHTSGEVIINQQKFAFLVLDFITGETIADKLIRENVFNAYEVKEYAKSILNSLNYLHTLTDPIIHNEITIQNVMLDLSGKLPVTKIIDFGYARYFNQPTKCYNREGLNPYYLAPECFNNVFSPQSDIFSVGVLMFHLLYGILPWFNNMSSFKADRIDQEDSIFLAREKPLSFPNIDNADPDFDSQLINIIKKALSRDSEQRFKTAEEMIFALNGEINVEDILEESTSQKSEGATKKKFSSKNKGKGFDRIAGMKELKNKLTNDVIELLNDKEGADKYGLSMPNGMLLYGPPGCGKTFFAERFAEEANFNYKYIRSSDLASIYVHGSQEKIGKLFEDARKNAPTILCFDELDALVPNRDKINNASQSGEVNEFLSQLNNCGEDGVFVIGTTNNPHSIDPAVMRSGRMDIKVFIPPPDFDARKALFELYLKGKPLDFGIDYDKLSNLTENLVISDIVLIIQEVGRSVFKSRVKITMKILEEFISRIKPSVSPDEIKRYQQIKNKIEGEPLQEDPMKRTPIGFKTNTKPK